MVLLMQPAGGPEFLLLGGPVQDGQHLTRHEQPLFFLTWETLEQMSWAAFLNPIDSRPVLCLPFTLLFVPFSKTLESSPIVLLTVFLSPLLVSCRAVASPPASPTAGHPSPKKTKPHEASTNLSFVQFLVRVECPLCTIKQDKSV